MDYSHLENCFSEKEIEDLRKKIKEISNNNRKYIFIAINAKKKKSIKLFLIKNLYKFIKK